MPVAAAGFVRWSELAMFMANYYNRARANAQEEKAVRLPPSDYTL